MHFEPLFLWSKDASNMHSAISYHADGVRKITLVISARISRGVALRGLYSALSHITII